MVDLASHQRMIRAVAARLVGDTDADDIVQETLLRALARPPGDTDAPIAPWLVTVARNLSVDLLRHRGRFSALAEDEGAPGLPSADPALPVLLAGLGALTPGEVAALLLRDGLDLDVGEVAVALETTDASVRVLHHRARRKAAEGAPLALGLAALDRFLTWLLGRSVAGLPVAGLRAGGPPGGGAHDPGLAQGVLVAHLSLLTAMIEVAGAAGDRQVESRALLSRAVARIALGRRGAVEDLQRAMSLGADRGLAEARLAPLLLNRGEPDAALATALSALAIGDHPERHGPLHLVAARVYEARGDAVAAAPHLAALRALSERDERDAYAAFARASLAMAAERFDDARADLLVALAAVRAGGNSRNEAVLLNNLAFATMCMGELAEAAAWGREGLALARSLGVRRREAALLGNLAAIDQLEGRLDAAEAGLSRALALCADEDMAYEAEVLRTYAAVVAHQRGDLPRAVSALAAVVHRLQALPGRSILPRVQLLGAQAEAGLVGTDAFDAIAEEAGALPSLTRALALYRLLLDRDPVRITAALAAPRDSAPAPSVARMILVRVAGELASTKPDPWRPRKRSLRH